MKNNKRKSLIRQLLLIMAFLPMASVVFAQQVVTGIVKDSDGVLLPGANVTLKGTTTGTITDFDGKYTISTTSSEDVLIFSMVGMITEEVVAGGQTTIDITLEQDLVGLEEVVVVGYGTLQKKDITGSVASIGADDINKSPVLSLDAGLQGKLAGVTLQNTSGAPGQSMKIRIRGGGSINYNNEPLYVIDGFIGGDITSVSPQDIERIDILKDASATAVYGSRGANGVVLITTKTAKAGEFKISFDATYGVGDIVKQYDILDAGTSAEYWNLRISDINDLTGQTNPAHFTDDEVQYYKDNGGTDYLDLVTRAAINQTYNLSMSGGDEKLTYMFSGGYLEEQGNVEESFRKRFSVRSNINAKIKPWLDMKFNTYATSSNSMNTDQNNRAIMDAYMYPIFWDNKDENGKYLFSGNSGVENQYYTNGNLSGFNGVAQPGRNPNPVWYNEARSNGETKNLGSTSTLDLNFKISDKLEFKVSGSGRFFSFYEAKMPLPDGVNVKSDDDISITHEKTTGNTLINTNMLTYKNNFGAHSVTASAIYEISGSTSQGNISSVDSLATTSNSWYMLGNGSPKTTTSSYSESYMQSYMGRVNYSYGGRYLLTATLRVDETSVFAEENRTGYFPSFAAGWVVSEEDFLNSLSWIKNMKVRAGYGETGNQAIGAYGTQSRVMLATGFAGYSGHATLNGTDIVSGSLPQLSIISPDLKWETTAQTNVGVDLSVIEGKVNITADWYTKTTKDVILQRSVAMYNGYQSVTDNFGEINNTGFELMVDWHALSNKDFSVNIGGNISFNSNEVIDLGGEEEIFLNENLTGSGMWGYDDNNIFIIQKGEAMGLLYGLKQTGLWSEAEAEEALTYGSYAGMPKYEDINDDNVIDGTDRQVIGHTQPDFTFGINFDISYKNLSLFVSGVGSVGNEIYNYNRHYMDKNMLNTDYDDRWTPTNTGASQQRLPVGTEPANTYIASQYVENGSFFKINNATLSYRLPSNILEPLHISSLSIFGSVSNLLTITNYSGLDPEGSVTNIESDSQSGIDSFSYPLSRTFTFGLKTTF